MKHQKLIILYFLFLILELAGDYFFASTGQAIGIWLTKVALMPILALWYSKNVPLKNSFSKIILGALFFSWCGDNFLMPGIFKTDINFLLGLGSFLIAHLFYIVAFVSTPIKQKGILSKKPWLAFPFILFLMAFISYLFNQQHPDFAEMNIPVIIYAAVIVIMVLSALNRYERVSQASFKWLFIGAFLFMVSDTVIALQNFTFIFDDNKLAARFIIMPLYAIGQFLIIKGCILQQQTELN